MGSTFYLFPHPEQETYNNPVYIQGSYAVKRVKIMELEKRSLKVTKSCFESDGEVKEFC